MLKYFGPVNYKVFIASDENLTIQDILKPGLQSQFHEPPYDSFISLGKVYWIKLDFQDIDLSPTNQWLVRFHFYDDVTLYYQTEDQISIRRNGRKFGKKLDDIYTGIDLPFQQEELFDGRFLYARVFHTSKRIHLEEIFYLTPILADFDRDNFSFDELINHIPYLLFVGGMLLMILYSFGIYFMNKDKLFIYYVIYLVSLFLYLGIRVPVLMRYFDGALPQFSYIFNELIQVLVNILYLRFAAIFLNAKTDFPRLDKAIRYVNKFLMLIMVVQLIILSITRLAYLEHYIVSFERFFVITFTLGSYIYILKNYKNKIVFFILIGSSFFLIGAIAALFLINIRYMMLGAAIEVFVFSLGMGYRMKLIAEQKQLIESEINQVKLTALRAQMNPHFIFNSLNSIRAYVISNEIKKASDYLTKFAKLIRLILYYSSKNMISLKEEIDALALYVELEQMRFRRNFGFKMTTHSPVDPVNMLIPPLILQPYVENAIRHGLAPGKGENKLEVDVRIVNGLMEFCIRDNGVGRKFHDKPENSEKTDHKSMAMELTQKRINLSAKDSEAIENIIVNDLKEGDLSAGTEVILKLPVSTKSQYIVT